MNISSFLGFYVPLLIIAVTFIVAYIVNRITLRILSKATASLQNDPTGYRFVRHLLIGMIYLVGIGIAIYSVPSLRTFARSILAGAGLFAVAIGFASQQALSNVVGSLFIVMFKPFKINDRLTIAGAINFR